ncbi:hypothetical protein NPIL_233161 [Nephila pilipes]|uniref:Uncharacterized protein n=1 Tax=Nephila pilipes TaxID=299642 RepID=A0A8X6UCU8_NEPPI|nr:hypothetical protein NPIL_233161 [Nephila pilipes]
MFITFFDNQGIIYSEFLPEGTTMLQGTLKFFHETSRQGYNVLFPPKKLRLLCFPLIFEKTIPQVVISQNTV